VTRKLLLTITILLVGCSFAEAQEWATKMFKTTNHDFGSVARGAKAEFEFELQNVYEEDVHIASVRSSCGCTTPKIGKEQLKTWEKTSIIAQLNTRTFLGQKAATITVVFDKPYYAEVQLNVESYIRSDVVFDPGEVNFGEVDQFNSAERRLTVSYAGRDDWRIVDVTSVNRSFEVELVETQRAAGRVAYEMLVRLKPDAPAGYFQDQLTLVTDDANLSRIRLTAQGRVVSPLTISPSSLFLGVLNPGESVTKQLVVRGKKPFQVTSVHCDNAGFEFAPPPGEKKNLHFIPVTYTATGEGSRVNETIEIETDLGAVVACLATATIRESGE